MKTENYTILKNIKNYAGFVREGFRYVFIGSVFLLAIFYQFIVLPESPKESKENEEKKGMIVPDLDKKNIEKIYENVLQTQTGDAFRVGITAKSAEDETVEILLRSVLGDIFKAGEMNFTSFEDDERYEYKEIVFFAPGRYENMILRIRGEDTSDDKWDDSAVYIDNFFITRVEVRNETEVRKLEPTVFGLADGDFLGGAKLEDLGKNLFYSFSMQNKKSDFDNLYEKSKGIKFDRKKQMVIGAQKNREFFVYKLDTLYPFEKLVLDAEQAGNDEKEIKIEYSLDYSFWKEISFEQKKDEPQKFSLSLNGDRKTRVVYVRVNYRGEERKSGFFALNKLSVNAIVQKNKP